MEIVRKIRWYQRPFHEYLVSTPGARAIEIAHRRWGKDEIVLAATCELAHKRVGSYWHCLPEYAQARKALWTAVNVHTGKRRIDEAFPPEIRENTNEQEMFIRLKNGSTWQLIGSDRYDATVGAGPAGIAYSEWALGNPSAWAYHRPMLEENGGWAAFITTPRGRNHAYSMYQMARDNPRWFAEVSSIHQTGALSPEQIAESLKEYIALYGEDIGRAQFEQEYECSFNAAILGAFYAREMVAVRKEERIAEIEAIPGRPVHRAWDIGVRDDTSIWWFQVVGTQVFILDCYSQSGVGLDHYADIVHKRHEEHGWKLGIDFVPHDAKIKEWGSGRTRVETMREFGLNPQLCVNASKMDGINAARQTLARCVFHPRTEDQGIAALEQYRREWDDDKKTFKASEVHDWASHLCLTGDMMVKTARGDIRLDEVKIGDQVITPAGPARVSAAGPTKRVNEVYVVKTADGRILKCTGDHPVFTERGLVRADALRYSDLVLSEESITCRRALSNSMASNTGFRDAIIGVTTGEATGHQTFIERFGNIITAQYRRATTYITSMATLSTTRSVISNACGLSTIGACTQLPGLNPASLSPRAKKLYKEQQNGMPAKKAWNGIQSMGRQLGESVNGTLNRVRNVVGSLRPRIQRAPNSVISIAKWPHLDAAGEGRLVYDLTVEKHHCFWANGILVSNCDAFRYLALSWRVIPEPAEKPRIEEPPAGHFIPPPVTTSRRSRI